MAHRGAPHANRDEIGVIAPPGHITTASLQDHRHSTNTPPEQQSRWRPGGARGRRVRGAGPEELNENDAKLLKLHAHDLYQVNMILNNVPIMRFAEQNGVTVQWTGFPVGYTPASSADDSSINHLKFKVLIHDYESRNVEIISTGEEGSAVISEMYKLGMIEDIFIFKF